MPAFGPRPIGAQSSQPPLSSAAALGADLFQRSGETGMVMVVVRGDQVYFHGFGETAPGSNEPPNEDSVVRLCSLTKIFTTDLLTKLVADQTVQLDDPLQRYAPPHVVVPKRVKAITLEDLATHTSGLPRELGTAPRGTPHFTFPDYKTRWRWLPNQHLASSPGSVALYSNVGFDLLGDALQTAARKPYAALLAERTLNPLGMRQTTFFPNPAQCARLLVSARDEGPCTVTENSAGSSGLYSTPREMAVWLKYLLGTGGAATPAQDAGAQATYIPVAKLLKESGLDHAGKPSGVGLGWIHLQPENYPAEIIEKTGGGAGFTTYIALNRARHTAIFLAASEGLGAGHVNLFKGANEILVNLAGLPPLPPEAERPTERPRARRPIVHPTRKTARPAPQSRRGQNQPKPVAKTKKQPAAHKPRPKR